MLKNKADVTEIVLCQKNMAKKRNNRNNENSSDKAKNN